MLFSSVWRIFVVLSILTFSSINCDPWSENGTVSSVFATKGDRLYMQDTFIRIENDNGVGIYGIFDGHTGHYASHFAANFFPKMIHNEIEKFANHPEHCGYKKYSKKNILRNLIAQAEAHLKREFLKNGQRSATTCLLVIAKKRSLTVANVGDSRAVMCKFNGAAFNLSTDHKPDSPKEKQRIEKAGGKIHQQRKYGSWRVNGISMSRVLGDHSKDLEKKLLIADPDITTYHLDEYRPKFMILASDGIWDIISSQDAVDFIRQHLTQKDFGAGQLARHVKHTAEKLTDNIAVVIVKFNENGHYEVGSTSA